ncbi:unnamed protein product, partial [Rotaria socialis]
CDALGRLGEKAANEEVIKGLFTALIDKECDVRACACNALGRLGEKAASEEVIKGLLIALSDQDYRVKKRACDALRQLGEKAASEEMIRGLLIALNDRDSVVRVYACKALIQIDGKRGDVHIMNALVDLFLRSDSECYHFLWNHLKNALYHSETMIILKSDIVRKLEISLSKRCFEEFLAMPTHKFVNALLKTVDVSWMPIVIRAALYQRNAIVVWDNFIWIYGSEEPKSGSTNTPGYRVEIEHNGNVHYYIAPRRVGIISLNGGTNGTAKLSRKTTKDLYHHIKQCEPFNKLTIETCLKSVSFGFSLKLIYNGQTTPDLTCPTNNTHLENLAKVVNSVISE